MNRIVPTIMLTFAAAASPFSMHGQDSSDPEYSYVHVDSRGNAGGFVWKWGHELDFQVLNDLTQFHPTQSGPLAFPGNNNVTSDPQFGFEVTYQRVLGHLPFGKSTHWGLESSIGCTELDLRDNRNAHGPDTFTMDTFPLDDGLPPGDGYKGVSSGPGASPSDTLSRSFVSDATTLWSEQRLSGQLYMLRMGAFVEWNFTPKLSVAGSAGVMLAPAIVDYDFAEYYSTDDMPALTGHSDKAGLLYGLFVSGRIGYDFTRNWGIYVGAEYQSLSDMNQSVGTDTAWHDPGAMIYGTAGLAHSF